MARISEKEAARLGLIAPKTPQSAPRKATRPTLQPPRKSAKGGRIRQDAAFAPFDLSFTIPFEPKTKHRPRTHLPKAEIEKAFYRANGSAAAFRSMLEQIKHRTVTPDETRAFESMVAVLAASAMRGRSEPYAGPVHVEIAFILAGDSDFWPTDVTDPDLDNMEKALCDALNGIVWKDDRLVVSKSSTKTCGGSPSIRLRVTSVANKPRAA